MLPRLLKTGPAPGKFIHREIVSPALNIERRDGPLDTSEQPLYEKSDYQRALDDGTLEADGDEDEEGKRFLNPHRVRYWSDYNRVYHIPRTLHPLPPPKGFWEEKSTQIEAWQEGVDRFHKLNTVRGPYTILCLFC